METQRKFVNEKAFDPQARLSLSESISTESTEILTYGLKTSQHETFLAQPTMRRIVLGRWVTEVAHIQIFGFSNRKNNQFQMKLMR